MKKLLFLSLVAVVFGVLDANAQTANGPLPAEVVGIANTNSFTPVAVYRSRAGQTSFACVGTIFPTGKDNPVVMLPERLLTSGDPLDTAYGLRVISPDSGKVVKFVGQIKLTSSDFNGREVVITETVAKSWHVSQLLVDSNNVVPASFFPSSAVSINGGMIKFLRSSVTGKATRVIGYGLHLPKSVGAKTVDEIAKLPPVIFIDEQTRVGQVGTVYLDEKNRIFMLNGPFCDDRTAFEKLEARCLRLTGMHISGASVLVGPIEVRKEQ